MSGRRFGNSNEMTKCFSFVADNLDQDVIEHVKKHHVFENVQEFFFSNQKVSENSIKYDLQNIFMEHIHFKRKYHHLLTILSDLALIKFIINFFIRKM